MEALRKTNLKDLKESWTLCTQCAACYYRGPIVAFNWRELPPPEWSSPLHKCPSFEYFKFGYASAIAVITFLILLGFTLLYVRILLAEERR